MTYFAKITGYGSYLPPKVLTNQDLAAFVDTSDEWITNRTGIKQRHIVEQESCTDLALRASHKALAKAAISATQIDAIIVATTTADKVFPSVACSVQQGLGANGCCAFDVQAVCAGFIYALGVANSFIRSGQYQTILVIGSDAMSRLMDWQDRSTCVLFGDGAGAMVLQASQQVGIYDTLLKADGQHEQLLHAPYIHSANQSVAYLKMQGSAVFKIAVNEMSKAAKQLLKQNQMPIDSIDWLIPHQANQRILDGVGKRLGLPATKIITTIAQHANTSAASIPLAFDYGVKTSKIKAGDICLIIAFGGGFSWGVSLFKF